MTDTSNTNLPASQDGGGNSLLPVYQAAQRKLEANPTRENFHARVALTEGQLRGSPEPLDPEWAPDMDTPFHAGGYDLGPLSNLILNGEDRGFADRGMAAAFAAGIGQADFVDDARWFANARYETPEALREAYISRSVAKGKASAKITAMLSWFDAERAKMTGGDPRRARQAPPLASGPGPIARRLAEIDAQIYVRAKPNPAYFGGPLGAEYTSLLERQLAGEK